MKENLHPISAQLLTRAHREAVTKQRGTVIWMCGLSGSGKSTLATALERGLHDQGNLVYVLDGDNIRTSLNSDLTFSDEDRKENIRRIAELSKLFVDAGIVTINSFITPSSELRTSAREIIGKDDLIEVFVKASFETCMKRDVKGLYAKAEKGLVTQFTGKDSEFEEPLDSDLVIDTESKSVEESVETLYEFVLPKVTIQ